MSKLIPAISERRSDRHFANKPLEPETVEALLDARRADHAHRDSAARWRRFPAVGGVAPAAVNATGAPVVGTGDDSKNMTWAPQKKKLRNLIRRKALSDIDASK